MASLRTAILILFTRGLLFFFLRSYRGELTGIQVYESTPRVRLLRGQTDRHPGQLK